MTPSGSGRAETALYAFTGYSDDCWLVSGATFDQNGNLYGTTEEGGQYYYGTERYFSSLRMAVAGRSVFSINSTEQKVVGNPSGGLLLDRSGNLYGTTWSGASGCGTVYELTPLGGSWVFSVLYSLPGNVGAWTDERRDYGCGRQSLGHDRADGCFPEWLVFKLTPAASGWNLHEYRLSNPQVKISSAFAVGSSRQRKSCSRR